jgi:hypothetical protein
MVEPYTFDVWWQELLEWAKVQTVVIDADDPEAFRESFDKGQTPVEALAEYQSNGAKDPA